MERITTPALRVIEKCGKGNFSNGLTLIAGWTGADRSRIHRWTYPKDKGGTGGIIPTRHQQTILTRARMEGIALEPDDFFFTAAELGVPALAGAAE